MHNEQRRLILIDAIDKKSTANISQHNPYNMSLSVVSQRETGLRRTISLTPSIGLVIPFYPLMNGDQQINEVLISTIKTIEDKLDNCNCSEMFKAEAVMKVKELFARLNFLSERKTVAIIMTPNESKVIYLSFSAEPVIVIKEHISFFELIEPSAEDPDFYYFLLENKTSVLYEYRNHKLYKIYEKAGKNSFKDVCSILNYTNAEHLKPVFVQGPPFLTEKFASEYGVHKIIFKNPITSNEKIGRKIFPISKIASQWKYWRSHIVYARIKFFQSSDSLIHTKAKIIHALQANADGLLMVGKRKRAEICKKWMFDKQIQEIQNLIENFLARGNRMILVDDESLINYGRIILLSQSRTNFIKKLLHWRDESGALDFVY